VADLCTVILLFLIVMCYDKDGPFYHRHSALITHVNV